MSFLQLKNIHKTYQEHPLLCGVDFTVEQGQIACLLGSSGSGKTTLLRIIAGLETAEKGAVWLDGEPQDNIPTHQRGVVLMFQDYALFPHRTVAENVAFGLRMQKKSRQEITTRVTEMLDIVGLQRFGNRDVNELSGGERQRVALARSLAPQPRLLLLDEPLGALDRNLRERLLEELPSILQRVGVTTITVTHDQEEAFALADRVILLHQGKVIQAGHPETVYKEPRTPWVARFLGLDNMLPATVLAQSPPKISTSLGTLILDSACQLPDPGTQGTLLIHTWGIHLSSTVRPKDTPTFTATVTQRVYHGRNYRLTLKLSVGALCLTQPIGSTPIPEVGTSINGWLDPDAMQWFTETT
ncbi:MAG: ABC transporter ATP-binding protein [Anaerolineae bacterium]|nr:ABC transporter ATP-binding protein [Anaerolineae bacterium]